MMMAAFEDLFEGSALAGSLESRMSKQIITATRDSSSGATAAKSAFCVPRASSMDFRARAAA